MGREIHIDAPAQSKPLLCGHGLCQTLQSRRICVGDIGEAGTEFRQVGAPQRAGPEQLDMIGNQHDIPGGIVGIYRAGGIGHNQCLDTQQVRYPHGKRHIGEIIALVPVQSALHDGHIFPGKAAEEKASPVVRGRGGLHVGDVPVGDGNRVLHLLPQRTQTGAQDDEHAGSKTADAGFQSLGRFGILRIRIAHYSLPPHSPQNRSPSFTAAPQWGHAPAAPFRRRISALISRICP